MTAKIFGPALVALVVVIASPGVASRAFAAGDPTAQKDAEAHIQKGVELRKQSRDAEALAEFQEAMKRSPSARAKAQVGLAQMAVGLFEAAEVTLSEVLASSSDEPWVSSRRAVLSDALTKIRSHLGTFNVSGEPKGATVEVNGTATCSLPCSVHVQAGEIVVRVLAPGFLPIMRKVSVEARSTSSQVFTLVRAPNDQVPIQVAANARVEESSPPISVGKAIPQEVGVGDATSRPPRGSAWPWITGGASVLALTFGTVEAVRWASKATDYNNLKDAGGERLCGVGADSAGTGTCASLLSEGHTARALAIGGFVVGAALGITSAILFNRESSDDAGQTLSCAPAVTTRAVLCSLRF